MKLIIGSQGYDGLILQPDGTEKRIEITSYKDGKLEFEDAQRVNSGNFVPLHPDGRFCRRVYRKSARKHPKKTKKITVEHRLLICCTHVSLF